MPTCVCLRTSMELHLSVRRECVRIDFYAIGGGIWKRFSTAKTIKMLTPFCILSDAVSPLLCQRSEIWKLYLGMHITFSLKVCQNKCRFKDSFKKSRGENLGSVCSVCADGNIFWSYEENNHTARYQHCFFPSPFIHGKRTWQKQIRWKGVCWGLQSHGEESMAARTPSMVARDDFVNCWQT